MKQFALLLALLIPAFTFSQIINIPADYPTIQQGINAANDGDTVLVDQGTYAENINFNGKAITVASNFIMDGGGTDVLPDGLVAHWLFNGDGSDASGNGHDGTASAGHPNWGGGMPELAEDRHGNADYCYKIVDGGNFVVPNTPVFNPPDLTISVWMKLYESWAHSYFISNDIWHAWKFQVQDANKPFFTRHYIKDEDGTETWVDKDSSMESLELDTWHHVVLTYTSGKMVFYIDGEETVEWDDFPPGTPIDPHEGIDLCIGQALPTDDFDDGDHEWHEWLGYFKGWLDDMRFYSVVLSDTEVKTLYDYEKDNTISAPDYISSTIIDGGQAKDPDSASVVYFISGEGNNSVLQGFTITNGMGTYIPEDEGTAGGGIFCTNSSPVLSNLVIDGNEAYLGGGILCEFSDLKIFNSSIVNNKMFCEVGGGMNCLSSNPFLQNVVFENNTADWGGAIFLEESNGHFIDVQLTNNEGGVGAGILCSFNSDPTIINSTIAGNTAIYGGGVACINNSNPVLTSTILWNNSPEQVFFADEWSPNTIKISYSDVEGGEEGIVTNDNGTVSWMEGNIEMDPLFAGTGVYPYYLTNESPCVNQGNPDTTGLNLPETDLTNSPRIYGNRIDMGAYENQEIFVGIASRVTNPVIIDVTTAPNPFSTSTTIEYHLNQPSVVTISIFNHLGAQVELLPQQQSTGKQQVIWNAEGLPAGMYYFTLKAGEQVASGKVVLVK